MRKPLPSDGSIQGARGKPAAEGSTVGTPPSGRATAATHSAASATIGSSVAPASISTSKAWSVAAG